MRELTERTIGGISLVGTRHNPLKQEEGGRRTVGVLILNFGQVPRAAIGDIAAHCADALCAAGYVALRFDFPGLGDSPGALPEHEEPFFHHLQEGGYSALVVDLVRKLCREEGVQAFVLVGMCSTTWTAVHVAESGSIAGLILLDPELRTTPGAPRNRLHRTLEVFTAAGWIRLLHGERATGRVLRRLAGGRGGNARARGLPADANPPLVELWRRMARRRLPALIVTAAGGWREIYVVELLKEIHRSIGSPSLLHLSLPGTNHTFTIGAAHDLLIGEILRWMHGNFGARPSEA